LAEFCHFLWRVGDFEKIFCDFIHFCVCALSGKDYRDKTFERGVPVQCWFRVWVCRREYFYDSICGLNIHIIVLFYLGLIIPFAMKDLENVSSEIDRSVYSKYVDLFLQMVSRGDNVFRAIFNNERVANIFFVNDGRAVFMEDSAYLAFYSSFVNGKSDDNEMNIDPDIAFFCFWARNAGTFSGFHDFWNNILQEWNLSVQEWAPGYKFDLEFVQERVSEFSAVKIRLQKV